MLSYHLEKLTESELKAEYSTELVYNGNKNSSSPEMDAINESDIKSAMKFTQFHFNFN